MKALFFLRLSFCLFILVSFKSKPVNAQAVVEDAFVLISDSVMQDSLFTGTYVVMLSDSGNISEIEVSLGNSSGAGDIVLYSFLYDTYSGLPAGFSYSRQGLKVTMGVGAFTESNMYFGSVRTKDLSGNWSAPYSFITN